MANWHNLYESCLVLGGVALGWWLRVRAPEGIEYMTLLRARRRLRRVRRALSEVLP